jgi:hypothetical protein
LLETFIRKHEKEDEDPRPGVYIFNYKYSAGKDTSVATY